MVKNTNKKGFTIIEVVLVLAIAGLIFLMVFIALPALQRGQRNTQRENDMSRILTAVQSYQSNNSNKTPWKGCTTQAGAVQADTVDENGVATATCTDSNFVSRYIAASANATDSAQFQDPDGEAYKFAYLGEGAATISYDFNHMIYVKTKAKCGATEGVVDATSGKNDIAIVYVLEGGAPRCTDNQ